MVMNDLSEFVVSRIKNGGNFSGAEAGKFREYCNTVYRQKWPILILAALVTGVTAFFVRDMLPQYRATATVMIESKEANVVSIQDVYGVDTRAPDYYETQFEIIKSRPVVDAVIKTLGLNKRPDFTGGDTTKAVDDPILVDRYLAHLKVVPIPRTQLVKISVETTAPDLSAAIVNAHADAFIENYLDTKSNATRTAKEWLGGRLDELKEKLTAAEAKLQAFKEREHLVDVDGVQALPARQLNELSSKLIDAKRDLSQTANTYAQVAAVRDSGLEQKLTIPAIRSDPLIQQLRQARADADLRVAELSKRYGPLHPKMKSAISERTSIEQSLAHQVDSVMEVIKNQHEALKGETQSIVAAIDTAKADVQTVGRKDSEYRSLLREVETNRQLFDLFYKRISETAETSSLDSVNARIVEPASPPLAPSGLQKPMIIGAALMLSLLAGTAVAILAELFSKTIKHGVDIERKIGVPLLAYVPKFNAQKSTSGRNAQREFDESLRTLRTGVSLSCLDQKHKLVMVTSSVSGEGKTTIACNLARSFARLEKVLLIDADLRRPSVAKELGVEHKRPGLVELCTGTATIAQCIIRDDRHQIDVLTAGATPPDPQKLLGSQSMQTLLAHFKNDYDRIIIDCPPALPVSDALLLAYISEVLVYVVKAESTKVAQVKAGIQKFKATPATVIGTVLNQVNVKKLAAYGEYGGGYYGDYYGSEEQGSDEHGSGETGSTKPELA